MYFLKRRENQSKMNAGRTEKQSVRRSALPACVSDRFYSGVYFLKRSPLWRSLLYYFSIWFWGFCEKAAFQMKETKMATPYPSIAIVTQKTQNKIELFSREFFEFNKKFEMNFLLLRVIRNAERWWKSRPQIHSETKNVSSIECRTGVVPEKVDEFSCARWQKFWSEQLARLRWPRYQIHSPLQSLWQ